MARKTKEETELTRQRILAASEAVFARVGFEGAALSEIADVAHVTKSLIHHHFESKQNLWDAVRLVTFTRYVEDQLATLLVDVSGAQFIRRSCTAYFRFLQENPGFLRMLYWNQ